MRKKLLSLLLALTMTLGLTVSAGAAEAAPAAEGANAISIRSGMAVTRVNQSVELYQEDAATGQVGEAQALAGYNQVPFGTTITVGNVGTDASAVFYIYCQSYTRRASSTITHGADGAAVDMQGKYFGYSAVQYLTDKPGEGARSAGEGLYWNSDSAIDGTTAPAKAKVLQPGESVTFTMPEDGADTIFQLFVEVYSEAQQVATRRSLPLKFAPPVSAEPRPAVPSSASVMVNGTRTAFDAYNIDGSNFFKLRDLAYVLNGTGKQFQVGWDGAANAISLTSGEAYTPVGGEMSAKGSGEQTAKPTTARILLNGSEITVTAYEINNNNYFKLRDIGSAFDFGVDWDDAARTISIDTTKGYTPD